MFFTDITLQLTIFLKGDTETQGFLLFYRPPHHLYCENQFKFQTIEIIQ